MGIELVERNSIQVVSRAARILRCLESEPQGLSLGVIATRSNLPRSTVQRLVDALAVEQLLDIGKNGVRLGSALMRLASHSHFDVTYSARAPLERLAQHTGETSALVYSSGIELIMLHAVVSSQELRVAPMVGSFLCVYGTAAGKICLSKMSDEQVTSLLGGVTEPLTSDTLSLPALLDDLRHIRQQGIAFDHEEHRQGIGSIAIGVETTQGFYSITVVGPSWRIRDQREPIILALKECQASLNASSCSTDDR
jgi:DNA-binding IclR family transcriptional regulator